MQRHFDNYKTSFIKFCESEHFKPYFRLNKKKNKNGCYVNKIVYTSLNDLFIK